MKSHDQVLLDISHVEGSSNLTGQQFCGQNSRAKFYQDM